MVLGDESGEIHRILGGPVLRRIAQLGLAEVVHRSAELDRHADDVDALLDPLFTNRLGAEDAAITAPIDDLEVDRLGAGIVANVMRRVSRRSHSR